MAVITVTRQLGSLGTVVLWGAVGSGTDKENCERAAARLQGVKRVDNQLFGTGNYRFGG